MGIQPSGSTNAALPLSPFILSSRSVIIATSSLLRSRLGITDTLFVLVPTASTKFVVIVFPSPLDGMVAIHRPVAVRIVVDDSSSVVSSTIRPPGTGSNSKPIVVSLSHPSSLLPLIPSTLMLLPLPSYPSTKCVERDNSKHLKIAPSSQDGFSFTDVDEENNDVGSMFTIGAVGGDNNFLLFPPPRLTFSPLAASSTILPPNTTSSSSSTSFMNPIGRSTSIIDSRINASSQSSSFLSIPSILSSPSPSSPSV